MARAHLLSVSQIDAATMAQADIELRDLPEPSACAVAYKEYTRLATFSTLFTVAVLVLVAATVTFLVLMLGVLGATVFRWADSDTVSNVVKAVGTLASAAGALVTGVAAKLVYDRKRDQDELVAAAQKVVNRYCRGIAPAG